MVEVVEEEELWEEGTLAVLISVFLFCLILSYFISVFSMKDLQCKQNVSLPPGMIIFRKNCVLDIRE